MKLKNKIFILLMLGLVLLISGCIKLHINQTIDRNGNSHIHIVYDTSKIAKTIESMGNMFGSNNTNLQDFKANLTHICDIFYENTKMRNANCKITDDYKVIMDGDNSLKNDPSFKITYSIPYITYRYNLKHVYSDLSNISKGQNQSFSEEKLEKLKSTANTMGVEMTYTLQMPGKITKASIGKIEGNRVTINLFDLVGKKEAYVESQELNVLWDSALVMGIILVIIIAIMLIRKKQQ